MSPVEKVCTTGTQAEMHEGETCEMQGVCIGLSISRVPNQKERGDKTEKNQVEEENQESETEAYKNRSRQTQEQTPKQVIEEVEVAEAEPGGVEEYLSQARLTPLLLSASANFDSSRCIETCSIVGYMAFPSFYIFTTKLFHINAHLFLKIDLYICMCVNVWGRGSVPDHVQGALPGSVSFK